MSIPKAVLASRTPSRSYRWLIAFVVVAAGSSLGQQRAEARRAKTEGLVEKRTILHFESTLRDEDQKPVSGVFQMVFELRKPKQTRVFWKEKQWLAVDNGRYTIDLGRDSPVPKNLDPKSAILSVTIPGVGEVMREALAGGDASLSEVDEGAAPGRRIVQYAEKSGFAYEAERATVADRIGAYTAALLQETLDALDKRKAKVKVGKNHINLSSIGGAGGQPFESMCPPGTVVVGIRGGSGIYIDNFQVVCAPIE